MALMMIQNASLPPSIESNMVVKVLVSANNDDPRMKSYFMNKKTTESFIDYVTQVHKKLDSEECILEHEFIDKIIEISNKEDSDKGFSLEETTTLMEQITNHTDIVNTQALLARGESESPKISFTPQRKYHGCGRTVDFAGDNLSIFTKMKRKSEEYQKGKPRRLNTGGDQTKWSMLNTNPCQAKMKKKRTKITTS